MANPEKPPRALRRLVRLSGSKPAQVHRSCDPDDDACAAALVVLCNEVCDVRQRKAKDRGDGGRVNLINAAELMATRWPDDDERLIAQPLKVALDLAVHRIGEYLHKTGGCARMERVFDLAEQKGLREGRYLDCRWDGVGGEWWS